MGCGSLLCAASALIRLPSSLPTSWLHPWTGFWSQSASHLAASTSAQAQANQPVMIQQGHHAFWQAGHTLFAFDEIFTETRLALFFLLISFSILCTIIAQNGLHTRDNAATSIPFSAQNPPVPDSTSNKTRFEPARERSTFSLRPDSESSTRHARPQLRSQSPSSSSASATGSANRRTRRDLTATSRGSDEATSAPFPGTEQQQHHAHQSLSFSDRISVKFRTLQSSQEQHSLDSDSHAFIHVSRLDTAGIQAHQAQIRSHPFTSPPTAASKIYFLDQVLKPTNDDERAVRKVYDDLMHSRAVETELLEQVALHTAQSSASRASLETALDALRGRRKADDIERANLRTRIKVLDEERRMAEGKRREAERKLDTWKAKVSAVEREVEENKRAQSSAKDVRTSLRDEWKRREREIRVKREEVERDVAALLVLRDSPAAPNAEAAAGTGQADASGQVGAQLAKSHSAGQSIANSGGVTAISNSDPKTLESSEALSQPPSRDQNNAKVARDRIKTLEGQIKKERERLERIKRSAQVGVGVGAAATSGTGAGVNGIGRGEGGHDQTHPKFRPAHPFQRHVGSPQKHHATVHCGSAGSIPPGSSSTHSVSSYQASASPHSAPSPLYAKEVPSPILHTSASHIISAPAPVFDSAFPVSGPRPSSTAAPSSYVLSGVFDAPLPPTRSMGPFDHPAVGSHSPRLRQNEADGDPWLRHDEGILPTHMIHPANRVGPSMQSLSEQDLDRNYSAGLLPRNLLSYADDEDDEEEEAVLNGMERAWASLEEGVKGNDDDDDNDAEGGKGEALDAAANAQTALPPKLPTDGASPVRASPGTGA